MRFPIPKIFRGPEPEVISQVEIESLDDLYELAKLRQDVTKVIIRLQENYSRHLDVVELWNDRVAADQDPV